MIILEGMDNSGKSMLAEQLLEILTDHKLGKLSEIGRPTDRQLDEMLIYIQQPDFSSQKIIWDRLSIISSLVYGEILEGDSPYGTVNNWRFLLKYISNNPTYLVYCRPHDATLLSDMGEQMDGVAVNAQKLIKRYDEVMAIIEYAIVHSPCPGVFCNYNWQEPKESLQKFIHLYKQWGNE